MPAPQPDSSLSEEVFHSAETFSIAFDETVALLMRLDAVPSQRDRPIQDRAEAAFDCYDRIKSAAVPLRNALGGFTSRIVELPTPWLVDSLLNHRISSILINSIEASVKSSEEGIGTMLQADQEFADSYFKVCHFLVTDCVIEELLRRQRANEDAAGRLVREFLVHKNGTEFDSNGSTLLDRARQSLIRYALWRTTKLPLSDSTEEKASLAIALLIDEIAPFMSSEAIGLTPDGLAAIVDGKFNSVAGHVRDRVRTQIETQRRRAGHFGNYDVGTEMEVLGTEQALAPRRLFEILMRRDAYSEVIARDSLSDLKGRLTRRQREFLEIRLQCDTQEEAAEKLRISASAASQLWSNICARATATTD